MIGNWQGINDLLYVPLPKPFRVSVDANTLLNRLKGSARNMAGHPYGLSEEFIAVNQMHQVLPEGLRFKTVGSGTVEEIPTGDTLNGNS
jgi:hypothetical protein